MAEKSQSQDLGQANKEPKSALTANLPKIRPQDIGLKVYHDVQDVDDVEIE